MDEALRRETLGRFGTPGDTAGGGVFAYAEPVADAIVLLEEALAALTAEVEKLRLDVAALGTHTPAALTSAPDESVGALLDRVERIVRASRST